MENKPRKFPHQIFRGFIEVRSSITSKKISVNDRDKILEILQQQCPAADETDIDPAIRYATR